MRFWLILACISGIVLFAWQSNTDGSIARSPALLSQHGAQLLDTRIPYRIGFIDPRFNISAADVQQISQQAAAIWHQGAGKELFVLDEHATLNIQLVFDERQLHNNFRHHAKHALKQQKTEQAEQLSQYQQQQAQLADELMQIKAKQSIFDNQHDQYKKMVAAWSSLGTIDAYTRQQLATQRQQLDIKKSAIQAAINNYNHNVKQANQQRQVLNKKIDQVNQSIENFNIDFQPWQFEKGIFNGVDIIIYAFDDPADLQLTIAHEFGHALGLKHNDDPHALMYPLLKHQNQQHIHLKPADIAMLE